MSIAPVNKEIMVQATPEHAFKVFAAGGWWPAGHSIIASGSPRRELTMEPRAGGRWYETGEDGSQCEWGKVLAWDPPRRMVLGWQINGNFAADSSATTEVEVNFIPEGMGTRVTLQHRGFENYAETGQALHDAVDSDHGWGGLLRDFATALAPAPGAAQCYFLCKLIVPRPTFMQDMSDTEGEALGQHIAYWTELSGKGRVPVFGPVGDPAGTWGLGVLAAADEAAAKKIAEDDPAVQSGLGFRCEVYPMLRAVLPE